jgi:hypothetical protein
MLYKNQKIIVHEHCKTNYEHEFFDRKTGHLCGMHIEKTS